VIEETLKETLIADLVRKPNVVMAEVLRKTNTNYITFKEIEIPKS
jgi:hypothetical protein